MGRAGKHRKAKEDRQGGVPKLPSKRMENFDDEDIDDDLAFDSEDEAKFGQFFTKKAEQAADDEYEESTSKKGSKKKNVPARKAGGGKNSDKLADFDALGDDDSSDDDDDDGFDISDLLDEKPSKKKASAKAPKLKHSTVRDKVTREVETIFTEPTNANRMTAAANLRSLVKEAQSVAAEGSGKQLTKAAKRLDEATNKKNAIFAKEVDPEVKEATDRSHTREEVKDRSKKWQPTLKEMKKAKNIQFPLKGAEESAVPTTLGTIESVVSTGAAVVAPGPLDGKRAKKRGREAETEAAAPSAKVGNPSSMAAKMQEILIASGLSKAIPNAPLKSAEGQRTVADFTSKNSSFISLDASKHTAAAADAEELNAAEPEPEPVNMDYVRKLKAMMSYEIAKRQRFNRIKSKTYRRILRKEKEREAEKKQRALEILNPEAARRKLQSKMEKLRAEERATQKHKNTSKWVKHVKKFSKFDSDTKEAIDEQHRAHQRLMQKMDEDAAAELVDAENEVSESEEEERAVDQLLQSDAHTLVRKDVKSALWGDKVDGDAESEGDDDDPTTKARRALSKMGFMQRAKERQNAEMESDWKDLKEDILRAKAGERPLHAKEQDYLEGDEEDDAELRAEDERAARISQKGHSLLTRGQTAKEREAAARAEKLAAKKAQEARERQNATTGRKQFQPAGAATLASGEEEGAPGSLKAGAEPRLRPQGMFAQLNDEEDEGESQEEGEEEKDGDDEKSIHEGSSDEEVEAAPQAPKTKKAPAAPATSTKGSNSANNVLGGETAIPVERKKSMKAQLLSAPDASAGSGRLRKVVEEAAGEVADPTAVGAFPSGGAEEDNQEYLVARAFANDEVDEDFLQLKERQVETIMKPKDPNASLPGWGEWGGEDERLNAKHKAKVERDELSRRIEKSALLKARVDRNRNNIVVNHEVDLVPTPYAIKMVPRPFANAVEFQRSMRQAKGPEWNTATTFREGVKPRIQTKQGTIIDPLSKDTAVKKTVKTKLRKRARHGDEGEAPL